MATIVKINNVNRMVDKETGSIIKRYDPNNKNLQLYIELEDSSELCIDASQIRIQYGGQITFDYQGEKYIVDDGYRDVLCKAGYIIMDNYDVERIEDREEGTMIRDFFMRFIKETIDLNIDEKAIVSGSSSCIKIVFENDAYTFTVSFDTINSIVSKNQERSKNSLPFYPFNKEMDKFGTIYFSFFAEKKADADNQGNRKFQLAEAFITRFIEYLNGDEEHHYRFCDVPITKRVLNWEGL